MIEREPSEIIDFFKEILKSDTAMFKLSRIYNMAKYAYEQQDIKENLIKMTNIPRGLIKREFIIDDSNAIFESIVTNKTNIIVIVNGNKSSQQFETFEKGILGWVSEKQGFTDLNSYLLNTVNKTPKSCNSNII